jgi:hypothetical protein
MKTHLSVTSHSVHQFLAFAFLSLLLAAPCVLAETKKVEELKPFTAEQLGLTVNVPAEWDTKVEPAHKGPGIQLTSGNRLEHGGRMEIKPGDRIPADFIKVPARFYIFAAPKKPEETTLDTLVDASQNQVSRLADMRADMLSKRPAKPGQNLPTREELAKRTFSKPAATKVAGEDAMAYTVDYSQVADLGPQKVDTKMQEKHVVFFHDGKSYELLYTYGGPAGMTQDAPKMGKMAASVAWINSPSASQPANAK